MNNKASVIKNTVDTAARAIALGQTIVKKATKLSEATIRELSLVMSEYGGTEWAPRNTEALIFATKGRAGESRIVETTSGAMSEARVAIDQRSNPVDTGMAVGTAAADMRVRQLPQPSISQMGVHGGQNPEGFIRARRAIQRASDGKP